MSCFTLSAVIRVWLTGTATPLILMLMGAPTEMKMSDAFLSAMIWNRRCIAAMVLPPWRGISPSLIPSEEFVQAGFCAGLGVDSFYNHRAIKAVFAVRGGQIA